MPIASMNRADIILSDVPSQPARRLGSIGLRSFRVRVTFSRGRVVRKHSRHEATESGRSTKIGLCVASCLGVFVAELFHNLQLPHLRSPAPACHGISHSIYSGAHEQAGPVDNLVRRLLLMAHGRSGESDPGG